MIKPFHIHVQKPCKSTLIQLSKIIINHFATEGPVSEEDEDLQSIIGIDMLPVEGDQTDYIDTGCWTILHASGNAK